MTVAVNSAPAVRSTEGTSIASFAKTQLGERAGLVVADTVDIVQEGLFRGTIQSASEFAHAPVIAACKAAASPTLNTLAFALETPEGANFLNILVATIVRAFPGKRSDMTQKVCRELQVGGFAGLSAKTISSVAAPLKEVLMAFFAATGDTDALNAIKDVAPATVLGAVVSNMSASAAPTEESTVSVEPSSTPA